jgi:hypothetical protein
MGASGFPAGRAPCRWSPWPPHTGGAAASVATPLCLVPVSGSPPTGTSGVRTRIPTDRWMERSWGGRRSEDADSDHGQFRVSSRRLGQVACLQFRGRARPVGPPPALLAVTSIPDNLGEKPRSARSPSGSRSRRVGSATTCWHLPTKPWWFRDRGRSTVRHPGSALAGRRRFG